MLPRFLVPDLDPGRQDAVLPPEEAHHLSRVLRLRVGDEVAVFDGRGLELSARVSAIGRGTASVALGPPLEPAPPAAVVLTLAQSVLKPDAMDDVVRDATMIGVRVLQPLVSAHTTVRASVLPKAVERWRRIALASAKQCGRAALPDVRPPVPFEQWMRADPRGDAFLLVEPSCAWARPVTVRSLVHAPVPATASLIVGPEGGWTREEVGLALAAGCTPLSLGRLTLRADAAPLAAAAALLAAWEE